MFRKLDDRRTDDRTDKRPDTADDRHQQGVQGDVDRHHARIDEAERHDVERPGKAGGDPCNDGRDDFVVNRFIAEGFRPRFVFFDGDQYFAER